MKKIALFISTIFASIGTLYSQVIHFEELPDSLNPFPEIEILWFPIEIYIDDYDNDSFEEVILYSSDIDYNPVGYIIEADSLGNLYAQNIAESPLSFAANILASTYQGKNENFNFIDLDEDGDKDLALTITGYNWGGTSSSPVYEPCGVWFFENDGLQNYTLLEYLEVSPDGNVSFVDVDDDGDFDIISHDRKTGLDYYNGQYLIGFEHLTFEKVDSNLTYVNQGDINDFTGSYHDFTNAIYFDLDQDNDKDQFVVLGSNSNQIRWKERFDPNNFGQLDFAPISISPTPNITRFDFGDINQNGLIDLIVIGESPGQLKYYEQVCQTAQNGEPCDDGIVCTENDIWQDCICKGIPVNEDADNDGICDAIDLTNGDCLLNESCDDGIACTVNDSLDENCNCIGEELPDTDGDGICNELDQCPDQNDNIDNNQNGIPDCLEIQNEADFEEFDDGIIGPNPNPADQKSLLEKQIQIFPNPSAGIFTIQSNLKIEKLKLFNSIGEEIPFFTTGQNEIDLGHYSNGVYILELKTEEGTLRKKLIKE